MVKLVKYKWKEYYFLVFLTFLTYANLQQKVKTVNYNCAPKPQPSRTTRGRDTMKVDSHIVNAIESYLSEHQIGYVAFAEQLGVSAAAVTKWRKVGCGITQMRWRNLFTLIRKYLPKDRIYIDDAGREQYSSVAAKQSSYFFEPKYIPLMVPTFTLDQLAEYDDMLESVTQLGSRLKVSSTEYRPKHPDKSGILAVALNNDDLGPILPHGTKMFICTGERPTDDCLVIAKPVNGNPVVGRYSKSRDSFSIQNVCNGGNCITGKIKDARNIITWVFPVLYYEVITF